MSFPFPTSNISDHITYNSFYSQLGRFASVCSKFCDFAKRSSNLLKNLLHRGFYKSRLKKSFIKFFVNFHDVLLLKYNIDDVNGFIASNFC